MYVTPTRSLVACNGVVVLGIRNVTHDVYGQCGAPSTGVIDMVSLVYYAFFLLFLFQKRNVTLCADYIPGIDLLR
jgi:hypothetical protein